MDLSALTRQLNESIGADHVSADPVTTARYAIGGQSPDLVAAPGTVAELSTLMAAAHSARALVTPWGGGTRQAQGGPLRRDAARPWIVVRTVRLNRVIEHEPADLTIMVEAGMTLGALAAHLQPHGQMLPIDAPRPTQTTLGGTIATGADGPRRLGYGTLRDLLLGVSVVEPSGRVSKAGGSVVKNVSGYDLMKLYLGSFGSLAIIVGASFKLLPRPRAAATVWCGFATHAAAFQLVEALHASQLNPVAVEYLAGVGVWRPAADEFGSGQPADGPFYMAMLSEGLPAAVERHVRDATHMATTAGASSVETLEGEQQELLWRQINDLPQTVDVAEGAMVLRLSCLPGDLDQALQTASGLAAQHDLALLVAARALSGVAYLRLQAPAGDIRGLRAWHQALLSDYPHLVTLACPPELGAELALWGRAPAGLSVMQRIKREFDPQGMLNPGRFAVG